MTDDELAVTIPVKADIAPFSDALGSLEKQSDRFGRAFSSSLKSAVTSGRSFNDTLKDMALRMSSIALDAGFKPLENLASGLFQNLASALVPSGFGGGGGTPAITPFAKGGIVASPTFFGSGGSVGLMGEAGAEAIMPLSRGSDGKLGVKMQGGSAPVNVTFNVSTPDATSFRRSQSQLSAMLARTVGRGQRNL
ncbi:phage tail tape measure protein [Ahrensia sp. R2A130]|uniref:phage tail tape measure protein n=1 Tax=Ahrensia sp. R2A130 TaxID=744979 RepID=UPI0001E0E8C5|nr:phage tail tape measure protein [Ahrensia sp. R2A130]EFL88963.1 putative tail tape measure protein [Ahrensia sp. R2A130]